MNVFKLFRPRSTALIARERLQILLSHERVVRGQSDLLALLREEILAAIAKHVIVERDNIEVRMDRGETVSVLEINIEIPHSPGLPLAAEFQRMVRQSEHQFNVKTMRHSKTLEHVPIPTERDML